MNSVDISLLFAVICLALAVTAAIGYAGFLLVILLPVWESIAVLIVSYLEHVP